MLAATIDAGVEVHVVIPAVPEITQFIVPVGALAPLVPVTVVVKVSVELSAPLPFPVKATDGATCAIVTVSGVVAPNDV